MTCTLMISKEIDSVQKYYQIKKRSYHLADLTVSKRRGPSYQIEIHFAVVNHLYFLFSFVNLVET